MTLHRPNNNKGLTLFGLMIAIVIIGIVATIAVSAILNMNEKNHIKTLQSDLSMAYKAAVLYFTDNPEGMLTPDILKDYGYQQSAEVNLKIVDGSIDYLQITGTHTGVRGVYRVDPRGIISKR